MNPVLKYPGSKRRIADWIISYFPVHHSYLEPFFGGGGVFFKKEPSLIETINDIDNDVINLFEVIRNYPEEIAQAVMLTPYSRQEYNTSFEKQTGEPIEKARIFLIKCWQSFGYRQNFYRVGWKRDIAGRETAYALKHWNSLPDWIMEAAIRLKNAQIENKNAIELIDEYNSPNVLIYCDPPYVLSTRQGKHYKHEMTDTDHEQLLEVLNAHKGQVILSGYDNDIYAKHLKHWRKATIHTRASHNKPRLECLWLNFEPEPTLYDLAEG